jgi:GNAT superfamily N-acetyltransferase
LTRAIRLRHGEGSDADYQAFCEVARSAELDFPVQADQMRERDARCLAQGVATDYWFASDEASSSEVLGVATAFELIRYSAPGRRFLALGVRPEAEGRGVGDALMAHVLDAVRALEVTELIGCICDRHPRAVSFAVDRGFELVDGEVEHELRIDLEGRDLDQLEPCIARVQEAGTRLATLPELQGEVPDWFDRLYTLWVTCDGQIPTTLTHTPPTPGEFRATQLEWPGALPEAYFIALDGDDWVGLSELRETRGAEWPLFPGLTGVLPSHRGRGIATALKVLGLRWARAAGYSRLRTNNAEANIPMLTANRRVGFERWASWHTVRMSL